MGKPPFEITAKILNTSMQITSLLGELQGLKISKPKVILRKENQIKTIQASLAIEGNTLSLEQVSDILDGAPVIGPPKDLLEVQNAIKVYDHFPEFKFSSEQQFKNAHRIMMKSLTNDAGDYRSGNVGVFAGSNVAHIAPQPKMVPKLMKDLFSFLSKRDDTSLLIKACVFHYELEFIHPFSDGNGRMGRLWQQVILTHYNEIFRYMAIESLIRDKQAEYYQVLSECDKTGDSTLFVEFSLSLIETALKTYLDEIRYEPKTSSDRIAYAKSKLNSKFSRKDYLKIFKDISTATASRDLKFGVEQALIVKNGDKNNTVYEFID